MQRNVPFSLRTAGKATLECSGEISIPYTEFPPAGHVASPPYVFPRNPGVRTIEHDLIKALSDANAVPEHAKGNPGKASVSSVFATRSFIFFMFYKCAYISVYSRVALISTLCTYRQGCFSGPTAGVTEDKNAVV